MTHDPHLPALDPFDAAPVALFRVRGEVVTSANPAARALLATEPGRPLADAFPPEAATAVETLLAEADGTPHEIAVRTGRDLFVVACVATRADDDTVVVAAHDITEQRRLAAVNDSCFVICNLLDEGANVVWQSGATRRFYDEWGLTPEEVAATSLFDWTHPEDIPAMLELHSAALRREKTRASWKTRWRPPGHEQWYESDQMGVVGFDHPDLGCLVHVQLHKVDVDVDAAKDTDDWRFHTLAEAAPVGILVGRLDGYIAYANGLAEQLLGVTDRRPGRWVEAVRPEDRDALTRAWVSALTGVGARAVAAIDDTGETRRPGTRTWININVVPQCDADDNPVGVIATIEDITEVVHARQDAERVLSVLDIGYTYVLIIDGRGRVLHANGSAEERLGIGSNVTPDRTLSGHFSRRFIDHVIPALEADGVWRGELELRGVDGSVIPVHAVARAEISAGRIESISFVGNDISELKEVEDQLRRLATHDILTDLPNRSLLLERLEDALARRRRNGGNLALLFCDLDQFKEVNDQAGHEAGDAVLRTVADRLRAITRQTDTAARLGGDEFVVLCADYASDGVLDEIAGRISAELPQPVMLDSGKTVAVGVSVGIAVAEDDVDAEELLDRADRQMYAQKRRRKTA